MVCATERIKPGASTRSICVISSSRLSGTCHPRTRATSPTEVTAASGRSTASRTSRSFLTIHRGTDVSLEAPSGTPRTATESGKRTLEGRAKHPEITMVSTVQFASAPPSRCAHDSDRVGVLRQGHRRMSARPQPVGVRVRRPEQAQPRAGDESGGVGSAVGDDAHTAGRVPRGARRDTSPARDDPRGARRAQRSPSAAEPRRQATARIELDALLIESSTPAR